MWWLFQPHSCKNLLARKIMFMIASDMDFYVLFCSLIHCVPFCFKKFRDKQREKKIDCANNKIKNEKTRSTRPNRYNRTWTNKKNIISFNLLVILWATLFVPFCFNSLTRTHTHMHPHKHTARRRMYSLIAHDEINRFTYTQKFSVRCSHWSCIHKLCS